MKNIIHYGQKRHGNSFRLYQEDKINWVKLFAYFVKEAELCNKYNINLRKGLMLSGPVGCGKTSMLSLWNILLPNKENFTIRSVNQITMQFADKGYSTINYFGNLDQNLLLDDIGAEQNIKHFGNESNVIQEIITLRYEKFVYQNQLTHITTNMTSKQIEDIYGLRIRSRLREMCNVIYINGLNDKRQ